MSVLITPDDRLYVAGHRGMAGSAICRALQRAGYGDPAQGGALLTASRTELDLLDPAAVAAWMAEHQPTVVVLAAAKVGGIGANSRYPADFLLQNLKIQTHVIETAWRSGVRRLLFLGSSCIYPKFAEQPIREETLLTGALEPTNAAYAIAKITGIQLCDALRRQHGFDAISLMPTNLYGPGDNYHPQNSHVLPALIRRFHEAAEAGAERVSCWGTGTPLREFLHVDDLGEACVFALEHWDPAAVDAPRADDGQPLTHLNVGTGVDLSIRELAEAVAAATGFRGAITWDTSQPDGTPKKQLDVSRLTALGWRARIPLAEGLASTVALFREQLLHQLVRLG
ncbi:GDP-L-fucose synthase [Vulcanococcus limneticus Candia 3F8]|uniref:GDP-L-fucose synthase family protein n=1 Tax=Vulcanococcus limneticus TaxID=2170428 RepID=UPI000B987511|nr:GDP-L-fucose synthase [Vulcanococcus limneticus]MCP9791116.1 GDP-L-fucose synthase [Vulcanococcus limneticus MW73D5]MCP9893735.1 GDP-L-fucose synthase [Vulcanococcus limneticus Candia 3F8]MCP9896514.1 GDP-L-fucose synthase [Vulcanococcus limneticus Candia 3B3]